MKVNWCDDVDVSPVKNNPSSYSDAKCCEFIMEHTPEKCKLEVNARDDIGIKNANFGMKEQLITVITMVMLSPPLHKHLVGFLDDESLEPNVLLSDLKVLALLCVLWCLQIFHD